MKVHILTAEHFSVPGIITKAFADLAGAEAEAMDLTNLMLTDNGQAKSANASNWRAKVESLQDEHGAAHCYVEIAEMDVHGAPADPVRDAAQDMLIFVRSIVEGAEVDGRWLSEDGEAIDGFDSEDDEPPEDEWPGATWEPYSEEEQAQYLYSIAEQARALVAKAEGQTNG